MFIGNRSKHKSRDLAIIEALQEARCGLTPTVKLTAMVKAAG